MKGSEERERAIDDATIELDANDVLKLESNSKPKTGTVKKVNGISASLSKKQQKKEAKKAKKEQGTLQQVKMPAHDDDDSDSNSEVEAQEASLRKGKKSSAFEQRDLVARAFAGDNVMQVCCMKVY